MSHAGRITTDFMTTENPTQPQTKPEPQAPALCSGGLLALSEFATVAGGEVAPHAKSVTAGKTAQFPVYGNGYCPNCGGGIHGDGYRWVLHCENATPETYEYHEPDAQAVLCANTKVSEPGT